MNRKNLKYIIFLVIIIIVLFFVSIGVIMIGKKDNDVKINPNDVKYSAETNTIIIKNIVSVSEDFGKTLNEENGGAFGYLEFSVVNNTEEKRNYQIYITKQDVDTKEINSNYIIYYLTDSSNNPMENYTGNKLPSYNTFNYIEDKADSKSIYKGVLDVKEKKNFILRVWIDDSFLVTGDEEAFSFVIGARAI